MHRRARFPALLLLAALAPACDTAVNKGSVNLLVTVRVSLGDSNQQGNGDAMAERPGVSADGRFVVFSSKASNLVPNDTNNEADVFLRDMVSRTTVLVSENSAGTGTGNGESRMASISSDGRYVAFQSTADDIHAADADTVTDVFVRDTVAGTTTLISRASGSLGAKGDMNSINPMISADGRYVVFESQAENLDGVGGGAGPDPDTFSDIYRRDFGDPLLAFATDLISVSSAGVVGSPGDSTKATISGDGRFVAFESTSPNLVPLGGDGGPDINGLKDCFLRDTQVSRTIRFTLSSGGSDPDGISENAYMSGDGLFVAFRSLASNLVPEDDGPEPDIYRYDIAGAVTNIASVHSSGAQAGNSCNFPTITFDGGQVVFQSASSSLVNGDANSATDCFVRDQIGVATTRVSVATFGTELNGESVRPTVSANGKYIAFRSEATNIADDDTNGAADIFLRGPPR